MKIEENYAFYLFPFFQIIFLCDIIIFFTPGSFSGTHVRTLRYAPGAYKFKGHSTPVISLLQFVLILFGKR